MASLPPSIRRKVDAAEAIAQDQPDKLDFLHAVLCQVGMPRKRAEGRLFERRNGAVSLRIEAGSLWNGREWTDHPLPYGAKPRLVTIHLSSEAVRRRSRQIPVGRSVREFLLALGVDTSGRGYAVFERQMKALAASRLLIGMTAGGRAVTVDAKPIERFEAWLHPTGDQAVLWPGELELSQRFYESLIEHAVPLDPRALAALKGSALELDCYTWLAHRLCRIDRPSGIKVSWQNLQDQFGQEYRVTKDFKKELRRALRSVLAVYPEAKVEDDHGGLLLRSSPPPIARTGLLVHRTTA